MPDTAATAVKKAADHGAPSLGTRDCFFDGSRVDQFFGSSGFIPDDPAGLWGLLAQPSPPSFVPGAATHRRSPPPTAHLVSTQTADHSNQCGFMHKFFTKPVMFKYHRGFTILIGSWLSRDFGPCFLPSTNLTRKIVPPKSALRVNMQISGVGQLSRNAHAPTKITIFCSFSPPENRPK